MAATWLAAAAASSGLGELDRSGSPRARQQRALVMRELFAKVIQSHGIELLVSGLPPVGSALLVSNHVSYFDPVVIGSLIPCVIISKADVARWPIIGRLASELGVIFVARGNRQSGAKAIRGAVRAFAGGLSVLNFPEGTTTLGTTVRPFKAGLFEAACRTGVPVVPVSLTYQSRRVAWVGEQSFLPHYLRLAATEGFRVQVRFHSPIHHTGHSTATELAEEARRAVRSGLENQDVAATGS